MSLHRRSDVGSSSAERSSYEMAELPRHQYSSNDGRHSLLEKNPQAIVNTYKQLDQRIKNFTLQLDSLLAGCRQLGRSYALILATRDLREGLENLLVKFHENASHLVPDLPERRTALLILDITNQPFPFWLEALAKACDTFRERLNEFKDIEENEKVKDVMMKFSEHLMYRACCLQTYKYPLETTHTRNYINDFADQIGNHLDDLVSIFTFFHQYGVPAMKYEQKRATEFLFTISTVSTFFSAVTATTLQTSLSIQGNDESNRLIFVVNTFWFSSLVLSIGSALHSLLAVFWKRTPYGSRGSRLPVLMTIWAHGSGPVLLAISIAFFWTGLVLFAYSSGQKRHTQIVTSVTTGITSFGLLTMAAWFAYEQYIAPLLLPDAPWRPFGKRIHEWKSEKSRHLIHADRWRVRTSSLSSSNDLNLSTPSNSPSHSSMTDEAQIQARMRWKRGIKRVLTIKALPRALKERSKTELPAIATSTPMDDKIQINSPFLLSIPDKPLVTIPLHEAIQDIEYSPNGKYLATTWYDKGINVSKTRIYTAAVIHSHSKSETSSKDGVNFRSHFDRGLSKNISWSSDSEILLVRLRNSVEFLEKDCNLKFSVKRPHKVESATWISSSSTDFLLVERSTVRKMSIIGGTVLFKYKFDDLLLRDIAVVPGSDLLLVTGRLKHSRDEIVPSYGKAEKQIILFDPKHEQTKHVQILSRIPLLDDIRHLSARKITKAQNSFDILLCHKSGVSQPSCLWTLQLSPSGQHQFSFEKIGLYPVAELAGCQQFIGESDQMIAGVDLDGDIHIWDRETARFICRIPAHATGKRFRCLTWSSAAATFASIDEKEGKIKIWPIVYSNKRRNDLPEIQVHTIDGIAPELAHQELQ